MLKNRLEVKRGDIIWLKTNVPMNEFGDSVQSVRRPYVVISNDINNSKCSTINIASISKAINKSAYPMHVYLDKRKYNLQYHSIILTEQVKTIPKKYISEIAGSLDKIDIMKLNKAILIQMIDANIDMETLELSVRGKLA